MNQIPGLRLEPGQWMNGPYVMPSPEQMLDFEVRKAEADLARLAPDPEIPAERIKVGSRKANRMARRGY